MLHNKYGKEVTPAELPALRAAAYRAIREELVRRGAPPMTDEQLFQVMRLLEQRKEQSGETSEGEIFY